MGKCICFREQYEVFVGCHVLRVNNNSEKEGGPISEIALESFELSSY